MTAHAEATMRAIWTAAGARDIWAFQRNAHIIGTCRMGSDAATAVVDPDGRELRRAGPLHLRQLGLSQRARRSIRR